jgi:two-component system response regulator YesN
MEKRVIRAIVVDDELNARRLLPVLIDWTSMGYEFAGEASNGNEALDLIDTIRPDVVFTDINMPYMDGLELSRLVREKDPLTKIVIMTAYPEFDYAKKSIQIGVSDFLLKPLQREVVAKLAVDLKARIDQENAHWNEYRQMQTQLMDHAEYLKEKFLNDLLGGAAKAEQFNQRYRYFFAEPYCAFCTVAVLEVQSEPDAGEEERLLLGMGCKRFVETLLHHRNEIVIFHDNGGRIVLLNRSPETDLALIGEQCIRAIRDKLDIKASVGVGTEYADLSQVKDGYREALEALRYGKLTGGGQVISFGEDIRLTNGSWNLKLLEMEEIVFFIKTGVDDQAIQAIDHLFLALSTSRGATIEKAHAISIHFISLMTNALSELGLSQLRTEWINGSIFNRVFTSSTIGELKMVLSDLTKEASEHVQKNRLKKKNSIIEEVKEHISQEFHNPDISLASVSSKYHLNSSYLSRIFKQETGQNFTDYLLKLRMEAAVNLLNETDWKAYQIAEKVGIKDPYYFSNCFKKVTGVSVQEYRKNSM